MPNGKVIIIQPAVPSYRIDFFDRLAAVYGARLEVYSSAADMGALTENPTTRPWNQMLGPIHRLIKGMEWQPGALTIPIGTEDIVVISGAPRCLSNLALFVKAKLKGARTIWWGHYWSSTSKRWRHLIRLRLMSISDAILFYTDAEVQEFRGAKRLHSKRIVTALNNGINTTRIERYRSHYSADDRPKSILFIGRLEPKAHLELLLCALARLELTDLSLHVVGEGSSGTVLKELCQRLGLHSRVVWHGGTTDECQIALVANRCRVFVYPGQVGLSLIHGMAYGLPTLVHSDRWSHMPEIAAFHEGKTGHSFTQGDVESLAQTLRTVIDDPVKLQCWSNACLRTVCSNFNTEKMAERFVTMVRLLEAPST